MNKADSTSHQPKFIPSASIKQGISRLQRIYYHNILIGSLPEDHPWFQEFEISVAEPKEKTK